MVDNIYNRRDDRILETHMLEEENRLTKIEIRLESLENDLKTLNTSIKDLVDAWKTAGNIVAFVKWISTALAAVAAIGLAIKTGIFK